MMKNAPSKFKTKPGLKNKQGYKSKSEWNNFRRPVTRPKKFEVDLYMRTTKEIAQYAGRTCRKTDDIKKAIEKLEEMEILAPTLEEVK
eukprot:14214352-Ditylum_brightwellii.AAC.1